jgi:adenylate kinase
VRNRLSVYREQTQPLEAYYNERGTLIAVDGTGGIEQVRQRIAQNLDALVS